MKDNIIDVLIYLFEHFVVDNSTAFLEDIEHVVTALEKAGFANEDVLKTMEWVLPLKENIFSLHYTAPQATIRLFSPEEQQKLSPMIRYTLTRIEQDTQMTPAIRECIIDRLMALELLLVDMEQFRWVMLFIFCFQGDSSVEVHEMENVILLENASGLLH